jgi:hypothetical protein
VASALAGANRIWWKHYLLLDFTLSVDGPRQQGLYFIKNSLASCRSSATMEGDIAGTVASMTEGELEVESERASYNTVG